MGSGVEGERSVEISKPEVKVRANDEKDGQKEGTKFQLDIFKTAVS